MSTHEHLADLERQELEYVREAQALAKAMIKGGELEPGEDAIGAAYLLGKAAALGANAHIFMRRYVDTVVLPGAEHE